MDLRGLVSVLIGFINIVIPVVSSMALAFFLWGAARFIYRSGDSEGHGHDRDMLTWGLVALFVLFSLWGIIAFLQNAFLGAPASSITPAAHTGPAVLSI